MLPCKRKFDKQKLKDAGLAQQNGFGPTFLHIMQRLGKCASKAQHMLEID
jgi:hypothetical protein